MKSIVPLLTVILALSICSVKSQFPSQNNRSPAFFLQQMKENNDALIEKQEATIKMLEGMQEMSRQIKIFSKRA